MTICFGEARAIGGAARLVPPRKPTGNWNARNALAILLVAAGRFFGGPATAWGALVAPAGAQGLPSPCWLAADVMAAEANLAGAPCRLACGRARPFFPPSASPPMAVGRYRLAAAIDTVPGGGYWRPGAGARLAQIIFDAATNPGKSGGKPARGRGLLAALIAPPSSTLSRTRRECAGQLVPIWASRSRICVRGWSRMRRFWAPASANIPTGRDFGWSTDCPAFALYARRDQLSDTAAARWPRRLALGKGTGRRLASDAPERQSVAMTACCDSS